MINLYLTFSVSFITLDVIIIKGYVIYKENKYSERILIKDTQKE